MAGTPNTARPIDGIVSEIQKKQDTDFTGIAKGIEEYHAHHPVTFARELNRINDAFHKNPVLNGAFPDLKIVGAKGEDLTLQDGRGHVVTVDSKNINRRLEEPRTPQRQEIGRAGVADVNPDGSGKYTVPKRQAGQPQIHGWDIAREVLKSQSGQPNAPLTDNQIANYLLEAKKLNPGKNFNRLRPGETINLPATVRGGSDTRFGEARQADEGQVTSKTIEPHSQWRSDQIKAGFASANQTTQSVDNWSKEALKAYATNKPSGSPDGITPEALGQILKREDLSADDKKYLGWVQKNWTKLQDLTEGGEGKVLTPDSLNQGITKRQANLAAQEKQQLESAARPPAAILPVDRRHVSPEAPITETPLVTPRHIRRHERLDRQPEPPPVPLPPERDRKADVAPTEAPTSGPPLKERTIWNYKVPPAQREARLPPEKIPGSEIGDTRAGQPVQDPRVLAQVPTAKYIGLRGDITVADAQSRQGWSRQSDQPYWLAGNAASAFLSVQQELAKIGKSVDVSGLNGAGRLHAQEQAIRARGVFAAGPGRISNHEVGRALDIDNWSDPDVYRALTRAGFRQGDRHGPIGGDLHHFSFPG